MRIARHVSELIGNTPLVELNSVVPDGAGRVVAKIEYLNPGGSAKDRIAVKMIDAAVVRAAGACAVTSVDTMVEGVHFPALADGSGTLGDFGHRADLVRE